MRAKRASLIGLVLWLATACKGAPAELGTEVDPQALCNVSMNEKRVTVAGHLAPAGMTLCSDTCAVHLRVKPDDKEPYIRVSLKLGDGENQLGELPKNYSEKDLVVKSHDGKVLRAGNKLRVTGTALVAEVDGKPNCQVVSVDRVDAM